MKRLFPVLLLLLNSASAFCQGIQTAMYYPPVYITQTLSGQAKIITGEHPLLHYDYWTKGTNCPIVNIKEYRLNDTAYVKASLNVCKNDAEDAFYTWQKDEPIIEVVPSGFKPSGFSVRKNQVVIKHNYWTGFPDDMSAMLIADSITFNYNSSGQLENVNNSWRYQYQKGELQKVTIGKELCVERFFYPDGKLRAEVKYKGNFKEKDIPAVESLLTKAFNENESRYGNIENPDWYHDREYYEVLEIALYRYEAGKLMEVIFSGDFFGKAEFKYNGQGQLTDLMITYDGTKPNNRRFSISFIRNEATSRIIQRIEKTCNGYYRCDVIIEDYSYNANGLIQKIAQCYRSDTWDDYEKKLRIGKCETTVKKLVYE